MFWNKEFQTELSRPHGLGGAICLFYMHNIGAVFTTFLVSGDITLVNETRGAHTEVRREGEETHTQYSVLMMRTFVQHI